MLEIFLYLATLDNALHKRINRSPDLTTGTFKRFEGLPISVLSAGAMICLVAM